MCAVFARSRQCGQGSNKAFCLVAAFVFPFRVILAHLRHSARKRNA